MQSNRGRHDLLRHEVVRTQRRLMTEQYASAGVQPICNPVVRDHPVRQSVETFQAGEFFQ
jgi:hypothetical protein